MKKYKIIFPIFLFSSLIATSFVGCKIYETKAANPGDDLLWMKESPTIKPLQEGEFTIPLFGDTQKTMQNAPDMIKKSFEWCVDNKEKFKIKYVCGLGDIVDDVDDEDTGRDTQGDDPITQLTNAAACYKMLKDANMNFSLILGNHDYEDMAFFNRRFDAFKTFFPLTTTYTEPHGGEGYQGSLDDTIENTYHYFNYGNQKYMIVCIGHHPDQRIMDWANKIIKENQDRKVILITHGYLSGGNLAPRYPYYEFDAGGYGERTPQGEKVFRNIVFENDNVEMVLCGHSLGDDNKRIVRSDTYNKYNHLVHQFMVNPADIDLPAGGCGLIALLIFRLDGTVDVNYYSPALNKFFNADSQFTFDYKSNYIEPSTNLIIKDVNSGEEINEDYSLYAENSLAFANNVYSYNDVKIAKTGLVPLSDDASITYKFKTRDEHVFKDMLGEFTYTSNNRNGGVVISTSLDGKTFQAVNSFDGVSQGARKISVDTYKVKSHLRPYIFDNNTIYIRLSFLKNSVDNISLSNFALQSTITEVMLDDNGMFNVNLNFENFENYDVTNWAKSTAYINDMLVMGGYLGTGRADDYAGAKGVAVWHFDAPKGSSINSLIFDAKGRLTLSDKSTFVPDFCLCLSYAINGGDYNVFINEPKSGKTTFNYDLTSAIKNATSVKIKLELWGDSWNSVGLSSLSIKGNYNYGITYHVGDGVNDEKNPTSYGASTKAITLYDPKPAQYYEFVGWYDNPSFTGDPMFSIPAGTYGSLDLYAKYEPVRCNITYHLNGGKNSPDNPKTFAIVEGLQLEPASRNGYSFRGWFESEDFSTQLLTEIAPGTDKDVDLYAKFLKEYRLTYVTNGGQIDPLEKIESFTVEDDFDLPTPKREGYEFKGWFLEKTFENKITQITKGTENALIVYAKWEKQGSSGGGCGGSIIGISSLICLTTIVGALVFVIKKQKNN